MFAVYIRAVRLPKPGCDGTEPQRSVFAAATRTRDHALALASEFQTRMKESGILDTHDVEIAIENMEYFTLEGDHDIIANPRIDTIFSTAMIS